MRHGFYSLPALPLLASMPRARSATVAHLMLPLCDTLKLIKVSHSACSAEIRAMHAVGNIRVIHIEDNYVMKSGGMCN